MWVNSALKENLPRFYENDKTKEFINTIMLRISPTNEKLMINKLSNEIFNEDFEGDIAFILYSDEVPVGLSHIKVADNIALIDKIGILENCRKKKMGDFFTRSLLFHFVNSVEFVEINYISSYFEKFGFSKTKKGTMKIKSNMLEFPSSCHK